MIDYKRSCMVTALLRHCSDSWLLQKRKSQTCKSATPSLRSLPRVAICKTYTIVFQSLQSRLHQVVHTNHVHHRGKARCGQAAPH